ncbi:MAG: DUF2490 domain-containing protein [Bacteroidota bacterium]
MMKSMLFRKNNPFLINLLILTGNILFFSPFAKSNGIGSAAEISIGYSINNNWSMASKIESSHNLYSFDEKTNDSWNYNYQGTDIQLFINRSINPFWRLALGYQLGTEPGSISKNRTIQQLTYSRKPEGILFGHRMRTDQTYYTDDSPQFRLRYRFLLEIPLQGLAIDPREFYLITSDELIFELQNSDVELENTLALWLGYQFLSGNELQTGVDYITDSGNNQKIWLRIAINLRL